MTRLSTLQYNMLRMFATKDDGFFMSIAQAQQFDQRPFRSMLIQEWISYRVSKGFYVTRKGREAYRDFENHSIERKNSSLPLTAYFDPTAYGLTATRKKSRRAPESRAQLRVVA